MDRPTKDRLLALAGFISGTWHPLTSMQYLYLRPAWLYAKHGYSVLGLVCLAHQELTGNGQWVITNPDGREVPDYLSEGEHSDRYLPTAVVEYFGFRDGIGGFYVGELPREVKRLMYRTRRTGWSSLFDIGVQYSKRRREIAAEVVLAMPPSLLKDI